MSPPGRPKGEYRSAQREGNPSSPPGRPVGEYRSAQREGTPVSPPGRPVGECRGDQHERAPAVVRPRARSDEATVLAFDFGTRRIGVAVGNTLLRVARPLTTVADEANAVRFAALAALIGEWEPSLLVVGHPVHADGAEHAMTARAERFARQLEGRFGLPVARVDERFTSVGADGALAAAGVRAGARKAARDEVAAQLILQAWFDAPTVDDSRGHA
jgi:putative Holliday junction resolvase